MLRKVSADITALKALRQAIRSYERHQRETLENVDREVLATLAELEEAIRYWEGRIDLISGVLHDCYAEAEAAAAHGVGWDCSEYERRLREFQEAQARVRRTKRELEEASLRYRGVSDYYRSEVGWYVPRALKFLDDRITALEAYHATRVDAHAGSSSRSAGRSIKRGFVQSVRRHRGNLERAEPERSPALSAHVDSERFTLERVPGSSTPTGWTAVYRAPGIPVIVAHPDRWPPEPESGRSEDSIGRMLDRLLASISATGIWMVSVISDSATESVEFYAQDDDGAWREMNDDNPGADASRQHDRPDETPG